MRGALTVVFLHCGWSDGVHYIVGGASSPLTDERHTPANLRTTAHNPLPSWIFCCRVVSEAAVALAAPPLGHSATLAPCIIARLHCTRPDTVGVVYDDSSWMVRGCRLFAAALCCRRSLETMIPGIRRKDTCRSTFLYMLICSSRETAHASPSPSPSPS